jgi:type IV secretory pathway TrbF-like protein
MLANVAVEVKSVIGVASSTELIVDWTEIAA